MDYGLQGKVALVTGGSAGIGKAIAKAFADEGALVVINGRDQARVDTAVAEIGEHASGLATDLTKAEDTERLYAFARERGPVDFLINNIGVFEVLDFFQISDERWFEYFDINVMTGVRMSRLVLRDMLDRNSGSILFTASDASTKIVPWMIHYSMTKTAQVAIARGLAELTRGTNVRVNSFMPGPTATESVMTYFGQIADEKKASVDEVIGNYFKENEPGSLIQRLIQPHELARGVVGMMCNPAVNGAVHRMEGGIIRTAF